MKVIKFKEINSTNAYLKDNYKSLDNLTFVVAEHQTEGRGRLGRCWVDQDDLLFSILVKENIDKPTDYSLLIASTLLKVLNAYKPQIKWPNDIMINNKKNPAFDSIFSLEDKTLHEVTFKLEISILLLVSPKFSYNLVVLIFIYS